MPSTSHMCLNLVSDILADRLVAQAEYRHLSGQNARAKTDAKPDMATAAKQQGCHLLAEMAAFSRE